MSCNPTFPHINLSETIICRINKQTIELTVNLFLAVIMTSNQNYLPTRRYCMSRKASRCMLMEQKNLLRKKLYHKATLTTWIRHVLHLKQAINSCILKKLSWLILRHAKEFFIVLKAQVKIFIYVIIFTNFKSFWQLNESSVKN